MPPRNRIYAAQLCGDIPYITQPTALFDYPLKCKKTLFALEWVFTEYSYIDIHMYLNKKS